MHPMKKVKLDQRVLLSIHFSIQISSLAKILKILYNIIKISHKKEVLKHTLIFQNKKTIYIYKIQKKNSDYYSY